MADVFEGTGVLDRNEEKNLVRALSKGAVYSPSSSPAAVSADDATPTLDFILEQDRVLSKKKEELIALARELRSLEKYEERQEQRLAMLENMLAKGSSGGPCSSIIDFLIIVVCILVFFVAFQLFTTNTFNHSMSLA